MGSRLRLLQIEDSEGDAALVVRQLRKAGYEVAAERVETAGAMRVALAEQSFDVVISDYQMPDFDAPAALAVLRDTGQDIPFVVVSGAIGEGTAVALMKAGAHDYLMKDNLARLAPAVERELREAEVRRERRKAEQARRESETRFATVFLSSPVSIAISRLSDSTFVDVNPAWTRLTGFERDEALGRSPLELGLWVEPAERARLVESVTKTGAAQVLEMQVRQRSGDIGSLLMSAEPIELAGERCMLTSAVDISERKRAEEALRESEKSHRDLVENLNDAVFTVNVAGRISYVSPAIERVLGYRPSEVLGQHYSELVHPEDRPAMLKAFRDVYDGIFDPSELRFRASSGEYRWLRSSSRPLLQNGMIEGLTGVLTDVTERRQAEVALRESRERLAAVFQGVTDGILLAELDSRRFVMANKAICELLGYSEAEILRLTVEDIHPEEQGAAALEAFHREALGDHRLIAGLSVKRKDGSTFVADVNAVSVRLGDKDCLIGVFRDMTAFNDMEAQLRQAQKMEAIGQLAGGVAHDFNNILCVIEGHCERLLRSLREDDPLWKSVLKIQASGERAAALTRQLLAFSRKQSLQPEVLDVNDTVKGLGSMLSRLIGEHVELSTRLAADLGHTKADRGQLEQVIINLAVNARDAMPQGGRLLVETANVTIEGEQGAGSGLPPGSYVTLAVVDTGCGIEEGIRDRIFEPFFTTKEQGKGTGLGLSTVYGIVTQSGGQVRVESELGRGSTFRVYLPRTEEKVIATVKRGPQRTLRGHGELVLVVEDEAAMREVVRDILADLGYSAACAANGGEALLAVEEGKLRPDLLLTDVVMPGMSGPLLVERLRRTLPELKVLFMSGYTDDGVVEHGAFQPGTPFIRKPFKTAELAAEVGALLSRERQPV